MSFALRLPEPWMTAEQFKSWPGDGTGRRFQLIDGEPVAMAPTRLRHGRLLSRLSYRLTAHLLAQRPECEVVAEPGLQPRGLASHNVRIPDLAVGCGLEDTHYLDRPVLIAEILSPSNMRETREAVRACLSIPSLREVLILATETVAAEVYARDSADAWPAEPTLFEAGATLRLDSLGFACAMDELYAGLGLP